MTTQQTPEQLVEAAAAAAAQAAREKAEKAAKAKAEKAEAAAKAKAERAAASKAKAEEKQAAKAAAKKAREDAKAAKAQAKVDAKAAKEATRQPVQNGARRPGPEGKCGKAWALMDSLSAKLGAPVAIADLLVASRALGLNDNMVRSNYASWRKFNGVAGRVLSQADIAKAQATLQAAEAAKAAAAKAGTPASA